MFYKLLIYVLLVFFLFTIISYQFLPEKITRVSDLESGDLVLLKTNKANIMTFTQTFYDMSPYTHVGIIYKSPTGQIFIVETHQIDDYHKSGLNVYPFNKRLEEYSGKIYINPLKKKLSVEQQIKFDNFIRDCKVQTKFPENKSLLYNYIGRCILGNYKNFDNCFNEANCAELVSLINERILELEGPGRGFDNVSCKTPGILSRSSLYTGNIVRIK